jgi:hypothetical protein
MPEHPAMGEIGVAFPERDDDFFLLILMLVLADRGDLDIGEIEPYLERNMRRLQRIFDSERSFSDLPFPPDFLFRLVRRSLYREPRGRFIGDRLTTSFMREATDRINEQYRRLDLMSSDLNRGFSKLEKKLADAEETRAIERSDFISAVEKASDSIRTLQWVLSIGVNPADVVTNRSVPVRIYLTEPSSKANHDNIVSTIISALEGISFERDLELPEENGSWWKRFWMRSKELATQEEIQNRLIKMERMAEARYLDKPQAEANKDHAAAVATIMKSLEQVNSACVQIGNILLVKHAPNKKDARVMVRTLNAIEMNMLEKNQSLLRSPSNIIQKLQALCGEGGI